MSKTIGIRVDEELDNDLETLAESMNLKKSQLLKRAFTEWKRTREGIQGQNMMQVDSVLIAAVFEHLSHDDIIAVADSLSSHVVSLIRIRQIEDNRQEEPVQAFLDNFTRLTGNQHFGWFTKLNYSIDEDVISIYGFHTLNTSYSQYAVELLNQVLLKLYKYKLIEDETTITKNSFILKLRQ